VQSRDRHALATRKPNGSAPREVLRAENVVTARSISEKFNQEPENIAGKQIINAEKNFGKEESAMKTKNGPTHYVFCGDNRTSITLSGATVLR